MLRNFQHPPGSGRLRSFIASRMSVEGALADTSALGDPVRRLNETPGLSIAIAASGTAQL
jgi:hypothetical protein